MRRWAVQTAPDSDFRCTSDLPIRCTGQGAVEVGWGRGGAGSARRGRTGSPNGFGVTLRYTPNKSFWLGSGYIPATRASPSLLFSPRPASRPVLWRREVYFGAARPVRPVAMRSLLRPRRVATSPRASAVVLYRSGPGGSLPPHTIS